MSSYRSTTILTTSLLLALRAAAQSTTVSVWIPEITGSPTFVGSIVDSSASLTTIAVQCVDLNDPDCQLPGPVTITEGPSVWYFGTTQEVFTATFSCDLTGSPTATAGTCTQLVVYPNDADDYDSDTPSSATSVSLTTEISTTTLAASDLSSVPVVLASPLPVWSYNDAASSGEGAYVTVAAGASVSGSASAGASGTSTAIPASTTAVASSQASSTAAASSSATASIATSTSASASSSTAPSASTSTVLASTGGAAPLVARSGLALALGGGIALVGAALAAL